MTRFYRYILYLLAAGSIAVVPAYAQTPSTPVVTGAAQTGTVTTLGTTKANAQTDRVANLKARADQEIDRRVASLNALVTKIGVMKRLSDTDRSAFTTQVQTEVTNLTTLKTKIDADTELVTLRTDVASIVKSYRVYMLFIPKIHLLAAAEAITDASTKLTDIATRLQTRIQEAQTAGSNVSALQTALTDMQAKIADANKQSQSIDTTVLPLTPESYSTTTLKAARAQLVTARKDLVGASQDAKTIIQGLKALHATGTKTSSGSATPSTTGQ